MVVMEVALWLLLLVVVALVIMSSLTVVLVDCVDPIQMQY